MPDTQYEIRYTLCFLTRNDHVLMLHRAKSPNKGLWNGVGGKIHFEYQDNQLIHHSVSPLPEKFWRGD